MSDDVELIKERLDLADVISEYVQLKRTGAYWKGLCPFHQEKTPSFVVTPEKGIWHCFGCGEGGDVFSFVRKIEGLDFPETLKLLAERAGVTLQQHDARIATAQRDRRSRLYDLMALSARFYHEILLNHPAGQQARDYLQERGVQPATIEHFHIGYAPAQWHTVQQFLEKRGHTLSDMVAAGLVGKNERGQHFDRFRGRIMFPVHDVQGRVVAFGGRITPWHSTGNEGKYVNSPETEIYQKRKTVYNLHRAKTAIRQQQVAIVVEGYMDVVMMVQSGLEPVIASSGTAFTAEQIAQLKRFAPTLHFAFDADRAGLHAAIAATQGALAAGMRVATIVFPPGQDPADVALADPKKLATIVAQPRSLVSVLVDQLTAAGTEQADRDQLLTEIMPLVASVTNVVAQGEMIQELAHILHVPEAVLIDRVVKVKSLTVSATLVTPSTSTTPTSAEQQLVGLLLTESQLRPALAGELAGEYFQDGAVKLVYEHIVKTLDGLSTTDTPPTADALIATLPPDLVPLATSLTTLSREQHSLSTMPIEREAEALVARVKRRYLESQLKRLQQQLEAVSTPAERETTLREFQDMVLKLSQLEGQRS